jgi:imidazole glycerol-phosphate synthase subunit HisH
MEGLKKVGAPAVIADRFRDARSTLGICVGMQVLFADSDENGIHQGIGMWKTSVRKLQAPILPHMGMEHH